MITVNYECQSGLPGNDGSVLSWETVCVLPCLLPAPVPTLGELWSWGVSGRALGQSQPGPSSEGPEETHGVRQSEIQGEVHLGKEVEIHQRPESSPVVEGSQEGQESHGVEDKGSTAALSLPVLLNPRLQTEHQPGAEESEEDAVPGLDVLHHDLAVVEDEVVLQLPPAPPGGDDEAVEETVGDDGVQDEAGDRLVTAGVEDVVVGVRDDGQGAPGCGAEGSEAEEADAGEKKGKEELVESLSWEERVETVESSHPHHH